MYLHRLLLLLIPAVYLMLPMVVDWWQSHPEPWFQPFVAWLALVLFLLLLDMRRRDDV
ncbi:hypothetical protein [Marinobacterium arenosum]|uniref:hypothetical protein n=1 Tax=Marinobacterium arenosum TaxID=2862496 RepID=UPI001C946329|nr:hypothetical protein [Marinobacterium arenosum]MBY4678289.1 hypothetical protein [Marinobacterium arenosum]